METLPIFGTGKAYAFEQMRAASNTGDLFTALLKESAERHEEAVPAYRNRARPNEARRDFDTRFEDRTPAPRRSEEPRASRPDPRDERRDTADIRDNDARTEDAKEVSDHSDRTEKDVPEADADAAVKSDAEGKASAKTRDGAQETGDAAAASEGSADNPADPADSSGTAETTGPAAGATPAESQGTGILQTGAPATAADKAPAESTATAVPGNAASAGALAASSGSARNTPAGTTNPAQAGATDPALTGAAAMAAGKGPGRSGSQSTPASGSKTGPVPAAAAVSSNATRTGPITQGTLSPDEPGSDGGKAATPSADGRPVPTGAPGPDQAGSNPALTLAANTGQGTPKTSGTGQAALRTDLASVVAGKNAAPAAQGDSQMPGQPGMTAGQHAQAAARTPVPAPGAADRPHGPAVPIGEVAVHIHRAAAKGKERIRIQLHPAELGQIDVRLKLGTDGAARAIVQVDRPETLDLLQRDARGLERALQDAGLKTDSNSLSFSLRDHGQDGLHERRDQAPGLPGGLDHSAPLQLADEVEADGGTRLSSRALDIRV